MKVAMRKDLTPIERKEDDNLFKDLKEKREQAKASGDDHALWIRRRGKLVNIGKYPKEGGTPTG